MTLKCCAGATVWRPSPALCCPRAVSPRKRLEGRLYLQHLDIAILPRGIVVVSFLCCRFGGWHPFDHGSRQNAFYLFGNHRASDRLRDVLNAVRKGGLPMPNNQFKDVSLMLEAESRRATHLFVAHSVRVFKCTDRGNDTLVRTWRPGTGRVSNYSRAHHTDRQLNGYWRQNATRGLLSC